MEQEKDFLVPRISDDVFEIMFELHQMSQQFKYIDEHTKVLFVKNKIHFHFIYNVNNLLYKNNIFKINYNFIPTKIFFCSFK